MRRAQTASQGYPRTSTVRCQASPAFTQTGGTGPTTPCHSWGYKKSHTHMNTVPGWRQLFFQELLNLIDISFDFTVKRHERGVCPWGEVLQVGGFPSGRKEAGLIAVGTTLSTHCNELLQLQNNRLIYVLQNTMWPAALHWRCENQLALI